MGDMEISFKDLLLKLLLKWRLIIICMLVAGILFGGIGVVNYSSGADQQNLAEGTVTLESIKATLSEVEQKNIELVAKNYSLLEKILASKEEHLKHSIRMNVDYQKVPVMTLTYRVETREQDGYSDVSAEDITSDIIDLYLKKLLSSDTYEMIISENAWDIDAECVKELITTEKGIKELVTLQLMASCEEECIKMSSIIKHKVDTIAQDVKAFYGEHNILLVDEMYTENANTDILREQQTRNNELIAIRSEMDVMDDAFTGPVLSYYNGLVSGTLVNSTAQSDTEMPQSNVGVVRAGIKYALLGSVIAATLVVAYVMFTYMFSSRLHSQEELTQLTRTTVLGSVNTSPEKRKFMKCIDRFICKKFEILNEGKEIELVCSNVCVSMQKKNYQKICLVTSTEDSDVQQVVAQMQEKIQKGLVEVYEGIDILKNAMKLEKMLLSDCVVVVEKENASKCAEIKRVVELCETHQVDVLGSVMLRVVG